MHIHIYEHITLNVQYAYIHILGIFN
jgi:hypothetical protein